MSIYLPIMDTSNTFINKIGFLNTITFLNLTELTPTMNIIIFFSFKVKELVTIVLILLAPLLYLCL